MRYQIEETIEGQPSETIFVEADNMEMALIEYANSIPSALDKYLIELYLARPVRSGAGFLRYRRGRYTWAITKA